MLTTLIKVRLVKVNNFSNLTLIVEYFFAREKESFIHKSHIR